MDSIRKDFIYLVLVTIYTYHQIYGDGRLVNSNRNKDVLLEQYMAVCGHEYLCDSDLIPSHLKSNRSYSLLIDCPECDCNSECFNAGNCCPDVFLSYPEMSCDAIDILFSSVVKANTFLLVNTCPEDTALDLEAKCVGRNSTLKEKLFYPPVIATKEGRYNITFKNKYCAECNDFLILSSWMLNFSCAKFADFNYLSSYDEIIELAKSKSCHLSFSPPDERDAIECNSHHSYYGRRYIDKCNTTGQWQGEHTDVIQNACLSDYSLQMILHENKIIFKNIFCYMCNPPYYADDIISECNFTLLWQPYDPELERSCKEYPEAASSYPYKNTFCQLCNSDRSRPIRYRDASVSITAQSAFRNQYEIQIQSFESDFFFHIFNLEKMDVGNSTVNDIYGAFEKENNVNLTNIFQLAYSLGPKTFCDKQWLPYNESFTASWSLNFRERRKDCYDFNFVFPAACRSLVRDIPLKDTESILLLDKCFLDKNSFISNRFISYCEGGKTSNTIFSYIPVHDNYNGVGFKDIFCALCNFNKSLFLDSAFENRDIYFDDIINDSQVQPKTDVDIAKDAVKQYFPYLKGFHIDLDCPSFITFINYVTLHSVLITAELMRCKLEFVPLHTDLFCKETSDAIGKCNVTGQWKRYDKDVAWSCEESLPGRLPTVETGGSRFRNEFCDLCNPVIWNMSVISSCNQTGLWLKYSSRIEQACNLIPEINTTFPFKNAFCRQCNHPSPVRKSIIGPRGSRGFSGVKSKSQKKYRPLSLRNIFALEEYDTDRLPIKKIECYENQIYDAVKNVCRNLTCYPGKVLNGSYCKPLLKITNNLRYVLTMSTMETSSGDIKMSDILKIYQGRLQNSLLQVFNKRIFIIEKIILISNYSCSVNMTSDNQKIEILSYIKIFVKDYIHRLRSEENLIRLMNSSYSVQESDFNLTFKNSFERRALHVPVLIHESGFENSCYLRMSSENIEKLSFKEYRSVHVAPLLTCVQTSFSKHEYRQDWGKLTLLLTDLQLKLHFDEFQIMPNGDAVVCRDRISTYTSAQSVTANLPTVLGILTTVCLVISIICLLITLMTYALFKPLRTLPGKNNIVLIVTLLAAQVFVLIQPNVRQIDEVCIIVGSLSHYFWLCYFGSLIVCSVHMFRVFSGGMSRCERDSSVNKTVMKYCLFSLGIPMIIVLFVVLVSMTTTNGRDSGYSSFRCFISDRNVFIATMITPLVAMCVGNLFFFVFTAYKIKTTPKVQKNKADKVHFLVYIKLFALTGLTWMIQIIDTFLVESFLSYISVILNCTQGLFLFLSYVCNKRVLDMCKEKMKNREILSTTNASTRMALKSTCVGSKTLSTDI